MKLFKLCASLFILIWLPNQLSAQYWFGVKAGGQMALHDYLSETYRDTFDIPSDINFQSGIMFSYTANRTYSVQAELFYKKIEKDLKNNNVTVPANTFAKYHFLSAPFMLRVNIHFGNSPFYMYTNGGMELNYWLRGSGGLRLDEFEEFFSEEELQAEYPVTYNVVFYERGRKNENDRWIQDSNRLQYAITGGFGFVFEFANGSRAVADIRYSHAHSNFGFNTSPDFTWENYYENFEYRPHQLAITLGYQIEYNADLARKGKSTLRESNR
jgi:hypothetical protein